MFGVDRLLEGSISFSFPPKPFNPSAIAGYDAHVPEQKPRTWKVMLQFSPREECFVPKSSTVTTHHSMHSQTQKMPNLPQTSIQQVPPVHLYSVSMGWHASCLTSEQFNFSMASWEENTPPPLPFGPCLNI